MFTCTKKAKETFVVRPAVPRFCLEHVFQGKLHDSRIARRKNASECGTADIRNGDTFLKMVSHIKDFKPQLDCWLSRS